MQIKSPALLFLIGMPGSGKSRLGKKLAQHLGYAFVDTDVQIEINEGKSIDQLFQDVGENAFRVLERDSIRQLKDTSQDSVIATGGGLPCYHNNMEWMNNHGTTIYLMAPVGILASRIIQNNKRPLFFGLDQSEVNQKLEILLARRSQYYLQSQLHLPFSNNRWPTLLAQCK